MPGLVMSLCFGGSSAGLNSVSGMAEDAVTGTSVLKYYCMNIGGDAGVSLLKALNLRALEL